MLCGLVQGLTLMFSFKILLGFQLEIKRSFPAKLSPPSKVPLSPSLIISNVCPCAEPREVPREAPSQHIWGSAGKPANHFPSGSFILFKEGKKKKKESERARM